MSATSPKRSRWSGRSRRPERSANREPTLGEVVAKLQAASRSDGPNGAGRGCSTAPISTARYAIIKLVTGGLRIGVSARLAKQALADFGKVDVAEIEELWHGLTPPYVDAVRLAGGQGRQAGASRRRCSGR